MKHDPRIVLYTTEPDPLETRVRAFCGALLGVLLTLGAWLHGGPFELGPGLLLAFALIAGCAIGAVLWGDHFWHTFLRALRWWG